MTEHSCRFAFNGRGFSKIEKHVSFPMMLDVRKLCSSNCEATKTGIYFLYGVVVHSGGMNGGHYIAYVRKAESNRATSMEDLKRGWHYFSDSQVHKVSVEEVAKAQAYILFYQRHV